jgi:hypothetical protein
MQPRGGEPVTDLVAAQAALEQLRAGHHAVLSVRQRRDERIRAKRVQLCR